MLTCTDEALAAVTVKCSVFWDVTQFSLAVTHQITRRHLPKVTNLHFLTCFLFGQKFRNADTEAKHSGVIKMPAVDDFIPPLAKPRLATDSCKIRNAWVRGLKSRSRVGSQSLHVEQIQSDSNLSNGMDMILLSANWLCRYQLSDVTSSICKLASWRKQS
jgi:hypothetical protein